MGLWDRVKFKHRGAISEIFKNIPTARSNCSPHLSIQNTDNDFLLETDFNHSVCQGDSGGPIGKVMQNQNESRFAVAGITSRGFSLCGWLHANIHRKLEKAATFFFNISCIAAEVNEFMAQAD
uniref:Peptidase S1 domain-containing protein n=1 Tax=Rhabditophanes sp. KR3021 TaxID=114890 RepID=A0AC35TJH5_9BILA